MNDVRDLLERAERLAPVPGFDLESLRRRRERRRRRDRTASIVVGLSLAALMIGGVVFAFRPHRSIGLGSEGSQTVLPPASEAPLEAGPGQYYYAKTWRYGIDTCTDGQSRWSGWGPPGSSCTYSTTHSEIWWATDESGRILANSSDGTYASGEFPHDTITTGLPTDPEALRAAMYERAGSNGDSPEPQTTVSPGQTGADASVEQSIVNLLDMPNVTPALRAGLLEVVAEMPDVTVDMEATDPVGRPAYLITVTTFGGPTVHELYVDPRTHELLAHVQTGVQGDLIEEVVVETVGIADSTRVPASQSAIPAPSDPVAVPGPAGATGTKAPSVELECSQGGPNLHVTLSGGRFDPHCLVVEAGSPFTIRFENDEASSAAISIYSKTTGERVFAGITIVGPDTVTYQAPALAPGDYSMADPTRPGGRMIGTLFAR